MKRLGPLVAVVVVLLAGVAGWVLLVAPPREDAAAVERRLAERQDALTSARTALQTAQAAKAQYRAAYAELVRLGKAVPADDDLQSLLVQLSATARAEGVDFLALERANDGATGAVPAGADQTTQSPLPPGATVGSAAFPVVPLKLTVRGRYFQLTEFLQGLDGYVRTGRTLKVRGRLLTIDGFTLDTDDDGPASGGGRTLTATVTATAYLVPSGEGATGGGTAAGPGDPGSTVATPGASTPPRSAG